MTDTIFKKNTSLIQHGPYNDRIYLMKLHPDDYPKIIKDILSCAKKNNYSKIFAKVPESLESGFLTSGFKKEATIPGLFKDLEDGIFISLFLEQWREEEDLDPLDEIVDVLDSKKWENKSQISKDIIREATLSDASAVAKIYKDVFETYPFPIYKKEYIRETMNAGVRFFLINHDEQVVACSSAEVDYSSLSAEMTDFATHPLYAGKGYAGGLLATMEGVMKDEGILTTYTICRAGLYPVNALFKRAGYQFGGRLIKNTNICGSLESMNVWFKKI